MGLNLLKQHGFTIKAEHLGGNGHRNLVFDVWSGLVWLKHVTRV
jgi:chemotaxis protein CheD